MGMTTGILFLRESIYGFSKLKLLQEKTFPEREP
jgi:hypothetical protein